MMATLPTPPCPRPRGRPRSLEMDYAARLVAEAGWGTSDAARHCGVSPQGLRARLRKLRGSAMETRKARIDLLAHYTRDGLRVCSTLASDAHTCRFLLFGNFGTRCFCGVCHDANGDKIELYRAKAGVGYIEPCRQCPVVDH